MFAHARQLKLIPFPDDIKAMRTSCPRCHSTDTTRARRCSVLDDIRAWWWFNRWPYRCLDCGKRFYGPEGYSSRVPCRHIEAEDRTLCGKNPPSLAPTSCTPTDSTFAKIHRHVAKELALELRIPNQRAERDL